MRLSRKRETRLGGPLAARIAAVACLLCLAPALPATAAASLSGNSSTYGDFRETQVDTHVYTFTEYLDVAVQNIGDETVTFHTGGWFNYNLEEEELGRKTDSDLQYGYLSFKSKTDNAVVNLGRVMVFEGIANERVDGAYARTDLKGGFGVSAFGGSPVETNIDLPGNNLIYGARVYQQNPDWYRIGVTYLKEEKNGADYRKEEGVDLWVHPMDKVELSGRSSYNAVTKGWMESAYYLVLGPFDKLRLSTDYQHVNYDDYFYQTTNNAFKLEKDLLTPHEKANITGEEVAYAATDKVSVTADYKYFDYDLEGHAGYYGGKVKYALDNGGVGVSYHRMQGQTAALRYNEYRAYAFKKLGKTDVAVDILDVSYQDPINSVRDSYSASIGAQYELTDALKVGADAEYYRSPDFDKDITAFIKVLYHFDTAPGGKGGA